jgi:hypothetical protein
MPAFRGSELHLVWSPDGGGPDVPLTADFRNFSLQRTKEWIDASAGADTFEEVLPGIQRGQDIPLVFVMQENDPIVDAITDDETGELIYGPEGDAPGAPRYSIPAVFGGFSFEQPYNDIVTVTAVFRQNAPWTRDVFPGDSV